MGYVFLGHSFSEASRLMFEPLHAMITRVTGLPVRVAPEDVSDGAQDHIIALIRSAEFCIIDITNVAHAERGLPDSINYGMNTIIEAGIALGAFGAQPNRLLLTCKNAPHEKPFMFAHIDVLGYSDGAELASRLHAACERRSVIG